MKKRWIYGGLLAATVALACNGPSDDGDSDGDDVAKPAAATASGQPVKAKKTPGIGSAVKDGKFQFTVKKMKCNVDTAVGQFSNRKAAGDYCILDITIVNIGNEPQTFFPSSQDGFIGGTKYATDDEAGIIAAKDSVTWMDSVNPGNTINVSLYYDVPSDKKLTKIELHDSPFSGGTTVALK
jgi:hypothetical protein